MRYIKKTSEPNDFFNWKQKANKDWKPSYSDLCGEIKKAVYSSLLREQGYLCCYCERELKENDYHIEHLNPQHLGCGDDLDYSNLICSCLSKTPKGTPLHCGMLKDKRVIPVHPLQLDCQTRFKYTFTGDIIGNDTDSENTIKILGLNIPKLVDMRKEVLDPFLSNDIDNEDFVKFVYGYLEINRDNRRNQFYSMIENLLL